MTKVPVMGVVPPQLVFERLVLLKFHTPQTTPLLNVPVAAVVPFDVPLTPPPGACAVSWSVLSACIGFVVGFALDVISRLMLPVTWPVDAVVIVADPPWVVAVTPVKKHAPLLMKLKPLIESPCAGSPVVLLTEKLITKVSWLDGPVPPESSASQFPLVLVVTAFGGLLLPQP